MKQYKTTILYIPAQWHNITLLWNDTTWVATVVEYVLYVSLGLWGDLDACEGTRVQRLVSRESEWFKQDTGPLI